MQGTAHKDLGSDPAILSEFHMDILKKIIDHKWVEVGPLRERAAREGWAKKAEAAPPSSDWEGALGSPGRIRVIAEIKRKSPSAGALRLQFDAPAIARSYEAHGADAISVLTDGRFFGGSIDDLAAVRKATALPVLRKDFIVDAAQILEAKLAGASAVLLIAECLDAVRLTEFVKLARSLGMSTLAELYDRENLGIVLDSGAGVVGVNNRDLRTFETRLEHTLELLDAIPDDRIVVSESGVRTREDVMLLQRAGVDAILVGETLMRARDPGAKLAELIA